MRTVADVNRGIGKNAAYATIAIDLMNRGALTSAENLWPAVRSQYKTHTGQDAAISEQGEVRLVVALFLEHLLVFE